MSVKIPWVEFKIKACILPIWKWNNSLMSFVEQLPSPIQITFGRNPQKAKSLALSRSMSCKCFYSTDVLLKKTESLGGRFWSNSSFIRQKIQFFLCLQHSKTKKKLRYMIWCNIKLIICKILNGKECQPNTFNEFLLRIPYLTPCFLQKNTMKVRAVF